MIETSTLHQIAREAGGELPEEIRFQPRPARTASVPPNVAPLIAQRIAERHPNGLYTHQSAAIAAGLRGECVCITTPTASGKTLVFTTITLSRLLADPGAVALALYPAKALLHDQHNKWLAAAASTGKRIAVIDGSVDSSARPQLLADADIVLMTPDVLHAWLMARLGQPEVKRFLGALDLVVLDEAHIYDGVFGTNTAYLLRRLQAVSGVRSFIAGSATIGDPSGFLGQLVGREFRLVGPKEDGAACAEKRMMLCRLPSRCITKFLNGLLREYAAANHGRFLIFADSRKRVEEIAADGRRTLLPDAGASGCELSSAAEESLDDPEEAATLIGRQLLPYRAGYEEDDRKAIQLALTQGGLIGVVTTSALELGIDIGDIELVVLLGEPPSVKSFWQRAGRAGRSAAGKVVLLDTDGRVTAMGLERYLARTPEPNWLYLDNEYLQYANALCAAEEQQQANQLLYSRQPFESLPSAFTELLDNELEPTRSIPHDLYPLKQQALGGPHKAFPLRSGVEKSYSVTCRHAPGQRLGTLTYSQVLREAFPGAIYRYMTRPYRIFEIRHGSGEIVSTRAKFGRTNPLIQTAVFPQFTEQLYFIRRSDIGFFAECQLQASERVVGFIEQSGQNKKEVLYGPGNIYSQKALNRHINTTGVCFHFPDAELQRETLGKYIGMAFCKVCSVQERDVGWGTFTSQSSPLGHEAIKGFAIYDSAYGSLRLTRQIPSRIDEILREAIRIAAEEGAPLIASSLKEIVAALLTFGPAQENMATGSLFSPSAGDGWVTVIGSDQPALCHDGQSHINEEVTVVRYLYTPQGIRYTLKAQRADVEWHVSASMIHPIYGMTRTERYNLNTGETQALS